MATVDVTAPPPPPHNLEAEQSVLGAILLSDKAMYGLVIEEGLRPEDFYRDQHRVVYSAMLDLYEDSHGIDVLTVAERLRQGGRLEEVGGEGAIHALAGAVPAAGNVRHYAQIVRENALVRRLLSTTLRDPVERGGPRGRPARPRRARRARHARGRPRRPPEGLPLDRARSSTTSSTSSTSSRSTAPRSPAPARASTTLDDLTGGFQPGNLIILAARPGMGKSRAGHEHRRERRAEVRRVGRPVLAGDVRDRARPALHRLAELRPS